MMTLMAKDSEVATDIGNRQIIDLKARPRSLKTSEKVARELASYIVDENLVEGTNLPTEKLMAESLGVGRTTMREALRLLETHGVLTIRPGPGGGPIVRRPRPNDLSESMTLLLQFEGATLEEVLNARGYLEPVVARAAASNIDQAAIDELIAVNDDYAGTSNDAAAQAAANRRFHSIVADNCGNVLLRIFTESLIRIAHTGAGGVTYTSNRITASTQGHQAIIDALASRDPEASEAAMRAHVDEAHEYWRREYAELISRPIHWR